MKESPYKLYHFTFDTDAFLVEGIVAEESKKSAKTLVLNSIKPASVWSSNAKPSTYAEIKVRQIGVIPKDLMDEEPLVGWGAPGILFQNYTIPNKSTKSKD